MTHKSALRKLRWVNDPALDAPRWRAELDGQTVAFASCTGRPGIDNYPWDWWLEGKVDTSRRTSGVADTLRSAKEKVAVQFGHEAEEVADQMARWRR